MTLDEVIKQLEEDAEEVLKGDFDPWYQYPVGVSDGLNEAVRLLRENLIDE